MRYVDVALLNLVAYASDKQPAIILFSCSANAEQSEAEISC